MKGKFKMSIQNDLMKELANTAKEGVTIRRNNIKFLVGQFQRVAKNKEKIVEDSEAIKIIKNLCKSVKEITIPKLTEALFNGRPTDIPNPQLKEAYEFVDLCEEILPKEASEEEIREFLKTVDFSLLKNKMQAIGLVNKHFNGNVDGNLVKTIVMEM